MAGVKSTKSLAYSIKGILDKGLLNIVEVTDEEEVTHDLESLFEQFHGQEVTLSIKTTYKLEDGVE